MSDVECPYCGIDQDINHDDGQGYAEDRAHEQQCGDCDKYFVFHTSISFYYEAKQADCLNGQEHKLKAVTHDPKRWPDWVRCETCDFERQGKYVEESND